jgi:integrase
VPSIRFHTLRACFATQLISTCVPATVVMKIAGWKDMKTMQRYIRLAGIDETGATEALHFIPTEPAVMEQIVNMVDYRGKR